MSDFHFESLSLTDYGFLAIERPNLPMHVAGLAIFNSGPLRKFKNGVDYEKLKQSIAGVIHHVPRYRQKLLWPEGIDHSVHLESWLEKLQAEPPVWVDDPDFELDYHMRHASVPRPGHAYQLHTLVAEIMSHTLDRDRPLWETWIIEGLSGNRFAILYKIHHCMADGIAGVELAHHLLSFDKQSKPKRALPYHPRPAPKKSELRHALRRQKLDSSIEAAQASARLAFTPMQLLDEIRSSTSSMGELFADKLSLEQSDTPLNGNIGAHRRIAFMEISLDEIKTIKRHWDTTINNVVLVIVTGAIRRYLQRKKFDVNTGVFRIGMPINLREASADGVRELHNEISIVMLELPISESRAEKQLQKIIEQTDHLNRKAQSSGIKLMSSLMQFMPGLLSNTMESAAGPINSYVTNVPGPQQAMYAAGAKMLSCYPLAPLIGQIGMCIGVLSYNGRLCWAIQSDRDIVPDTDLLISYLQDNFDKVYQRASKKSAKGIR